jgi:hypothetical protein|tara:strand:+ start:459 stop:1073 length:615 start_codon:yes stop_codon:yes gene_type:complete
MMQTLQHLGVPLVGVGDYDLKGNSYLHRQDIPKEYHDKISQHNPKGYYDIPFERLIDYVYSPHKGEAIKILGPINIAFVPEKNIDKVILCERRDKKEQAISFMELAKLDVELMDKEVRLGRMDPDSLRAKALEIYRTMSLEDCERMIMFGHESIRRWWRDLGVKFMTIFFDVMLETPELTIKEVQKFLCLEGSIDKAVDNVSTS